MFAVSVNSGRAGIVDVAAGGLAFWLTGFGRQLRVLVVGGHDVGKTVIIRRLVGQGLVAEAGELNESASSASLRGHHRHHFCIVLYSIKIFNVA